IRVNIPRDSVMPFWGSSLSRPLEICSADTDLTDLLPDARSRFRPGPRPTSVGRGRRLSVSLPPSDASPHKLILSWLPVRAPGTGQQGVSGPVRALRESVRFHGTGFATIIA